MRDGDRLQTFTCSLGYSCSRFPCDMPLATSTKGGGIADGFDRPSVLPSAVGHAARTRSSMENCWNGSRCSGHRPTEHETPGAAALQAGQARHLHRVAATTATRGRLSEGHDGALRATSWTLVSWENPHVHALSLANQPVYEIAPQLQPPVPMRAASYEHLSNAT